MVELPSQPLGDIDPEFEKIALETGELTYGLSGTTTREKLLPNLAHDVCREHFGLAFRLHVQAALFHGVPFSDVLGVVRFRVRTQAIQLPPTLSSASVISGPSLELMFEPRRPSRLQRLVGDARPALVARGRL